MDRDHCLFWHKSQGRQMKPCAKQKKKKELFMQQVVKVIVKQVQEEAEQGSRREIHWGY